MTCGIYVIWCNKRPYIGQSVNIEDRWKAHVRLLKRGTHPNGIIQHTWNKYGSTSFSFTILESCSHDELTVREQYWYDHYGSFFVGCNLSPIAHSPSLGRHLADATKAKMSKAMKDRKDDKRRLTDEQVLDIWLCYMDGEACTSIADRYIINSKSIWYIVTRRYYREVELPPSCRRKERRRKGGGRKPNVQSTSIP